MAAQGASDGDARLNLPSRPLVRRSTRVAVRSARPRCLPTWPLCATCDVGAALAHSPVASTRCPDATRVYQTHLGTDPLSAATDSGSHRAEPIQGAHPSVRSCRLSSAVPSSSCRRHQRRLTWRLRARRSWGEVECRKESGRARERDRRHLRPPLALALRPSLFARSVSWTPARHSSWSWRLISAGCKLLCGSRELLDSHHSRPTLPAASATRGLICLLSGQSAILSPSTVGAWG